MENSFYRHSKRNSSIELLRIFAGMAVVVLHFNFFKLHAVELTSGITQHTLLFFEAVCVCAVNVFIAISGYCSAYSSKINLCRLLNLIVQTSVFRFIFVLIICCLHDSFSIKRLVGALLPVNYYVILYVSLMFVAPYINLLMAKLSKEGLTVFVCMILSVFSIYPTLVDVLIEITGSNLVGLSSISCIGSINGYTIINFILVYIMGAYIRKMNLINKYRHITLVLCCIILVILIYCLYGILPNMAYNYSNPLVVMEACVILMIFAKFNFNNKLINFIAPASFTCFLIHNHILDYVSKKVTIIDSFSYVVTLLIACVLGLYLLSVFVMKMWDFFVDIVLSKLLTKIPSIEIKEGK